MKRKQRARLFSMIATFLMVSSLMTPAFAASEANGSVHRSVHDYSTLNVKDKVSERLLGEFDEDEKVTFLVKFADKAEVKKVAEEAENKASLSNLSGQEAQLLKRSAILSELKATSFESHKNVIAYLEEEIEAGTVSDYHSYNIVNGMAVTATKEVAEKIAAFPEVDKLLKNETRQLNKTFEQDDEITLQDDSEIEWNVDRIDAPVAWTMGIDGTGTVVASLDTGAEWEHPALKEKYRGYDSSTGEVDHQYSFFDATPLGNSEAYDDEGHGTHVTGTMVGSEVDGSNQVGVAPGAEWISVKVFDASGSTTDDILLEGADWLLEPGGRVDLAPDAVNNSWSGGSGIDEWYMEAVENWRDYDIFPEFSAGNTTIFNPGGPGSVANPANYPISFATGATDSNDMIADFSLRGPSPYGEIKPNVSAPGVNVRSSIPGGGYGVSSGTSMAGPAVTAVAAMLRQVNANISVDQMEEILMSTATERTDDEYPESPNNGYGHGIVNAENAVASILDGLGTVEGQVTQDGEDNEEPTYQHTPITETYAGLNVNLIVEAQDNISVTSVELHYEIDGGDVQVIEADRVSGDYTDGEYHAEILGEDVEGELLTYKWVINDFGNNEVVSDEYEVTIKAGITPGYSENFDSKPSGWEAFGENNSWEWGAPTSGPGSSLTGENVYATNLDGTYDSNMDATLVMPPLELPDDDALFLELTHWHNFEESSSGRAWDSGHLNISTDLENWTELQMFQGESNEWITEEVNLTDYAGERVFIGFQALSDGSVNRDGWYIDEISLHDSSRFEDDNEAPTFDHEPPAMAFIDNDLHLTIDAQDDVKLKSVELSYVDGNDEWATVEAEQSSGNDQSGTFEAIVPGEVVTGESVTYYWTVEDYGGNSTVSDEYVISIEPHITVGYFEDFESSPAGWYSFGDNDSWEWGVPTSGPESATSGEKVYATNLSGDYANSMEAFLIMPPADLPEGEKSLKFKSWHDFEQSSTGRAWDYGDVVVSTDLETWDLVQEFAGESDGWEDVQVDLSDYSGEVYIGFRAYSDISVTREGWYIDDVEIAGPEEGSSPSLGIGLGLMNNDADNFTSLQELTNSLTRAQDAQVNVEKQVLTQAPLETKEKTLVEQAEITPTQLPLGAQVSVLESGRTVNTNPADGSYSILHSAGTYTVEAGAYGYESEQQSVEILDNEVSTANFMLNELAKGTIHGTVTDENTGDPIAGAQALLVEDANVDPVETDGDGNFSMTAYEGTYTVKVMARDYHGAEVEVTVEEGSVDLNIELEPYYTYPGGEIGYDDGVADNARAYYDAGNGWAVKMSLPEGKDSAIVTDGVFKFWDDEFPVPGGTHFQVEVWDASGSNGLPGEKLAGPVDAEAIRDKDEWTVVDLTEHNIMVEEDFYMVYIQTDVNTAAPGLATDETSPNSNRNYRIVGGAWEESAADDGNYMIRSRIAYEVEEPVITSPSEDLITSDEEITIEGTASPTTTVELQNNGEEVDSIEVGDDGEFSFSTTLTEGENEFTAVSLLDGAPAGESESVTVTLDTIAPELTIDNPTHGDKTNRETVTVEGTVSDEHLDYVEVNGQKADIDGDSYSKRILLDQGENVIEVIAVDLAGNRTTELVTIHVKYDAPEISNLTPTEDHYLETGDTVMVEFDSEPGLDATFVVHMPLANLNGNLMNANPTEFPMRETSEGKYVGYWTIPTNAYADGARIEVKASDSFGNETREVANGKLFINLEE